MNGKKMSLLLLITGCIIVLSGCGLFGSSDPETSSEPLDPPPLEEMDNEADVEIGEAVTSPETGEQGEAAAGEAETASETYPATLYVLDDKGMVVPYETEIPEVEGIAQQVLRYMVKGGPGENKLPEGFSAVLPEGTEILGMTIKDGVATIDFSPEFKEYSAEMEQQIVDAITWSMTEFDSIDSVKIWINGYEQDVMPVNGTPISSLNRKNGINVELADGASVGNTTPVTLYFMGQTASGDFTYYVPVTRLVPETDNVAEATLEALIKGPKQEGLYSGVLPSTSVITAQRQGEKVVANFDETLLQFDSGKASPEAMNAIVLSLIESTGAQKVQVFVNGNTEVLAGDRNYSVPVSKPVSVNTAGL